MTTIIDGSAGITFPSGGNPQAAPSKVLQVVNATLSTAASTSAASYQATGLTASITPLFSTSRIYIVISAEMDTGVANTQAQVTIFKNGSNLVGNAGLTSMFSAANRVIGTVSCSYMDSPATTSSTTYAVYFLSGSGTGPVIFNFGPATATITLMEIAQ